MVLLCRESGVKKRKVAVEVIESKEDDGQDGGGEKVGKEKGKGKGG